MSGINVPKFTLTPHLDLADRIGSNRMPRMFIPAFHHPSEDSISNFHHSSRPLLRWSASFHFAKTPGTNAPSRSDVEYQITRRDPIVLYRFFYILSPCRSASRSNRVCPKCSPSRAQADPFQVSVTRAFPVAWLYCRRNSGKQ
jgi:hypothetical protein